MSTEGVAAAPLYPLLFEDLVRRALAEDLGRAGDLTTDAIVSPQAVGSARIVARQSGRVAGLDVALHVFRLLDPGVEVRAVCGDGADVAPGEVLVELRGRLRALLAGERTALNLLAHLSGIATVTREASRQLEGTAAKLVCTRKTTPGLRALEKYAVRVGGGQNHRFGLDDAVLVKDNHVAAAGGIGAAVERVRAGVGHMVRVEVEVDTLEQLEEALALGVEVILLDNMTLEQLTEAVRRSRGQALLEASGGVRAETLAAIAGTGVDLISAGFLTHSAASLDLSLEVFPDRA